MLDFRKLLLAFAILTIAVGSAFAQPNPLGCVAQAAGTPSIRAEGVAELVGDVLINCQGGQPTAFGANLPQVNIQVFTSPVINVTSRLQADPFTEALLFIDEPGPAEQVLCGSTGFIYAVPNGSPAGTPIIAGVCANISGAPGSDGRGTYARATANPSTGVWQRGNTFQARRATANSLIWQGVPFDPPGSNNTRVLRLVNVRVNASQLGVPSGAQASVSLIISTSASGVGLPIGLPITNPAPVVAIAQNSLTFSVVDPQTCLQCESANKDFSTDSTKTLAPQGTKCDSIVFNLRYQELFPSVFRRRAADAPAVTDTVAPTPSVNQDSMGLPFQTESGYYKVTAQSTTNGYWTSPLQNGSLSLGTAGNIGLADHGTRLIVRFTNVQNGLQIWTANTVQIVTIQGNNLNTQLRTGTARLVQTNPNGDGPHSPAPVGAATGGGINQISVIGGTGQAVYEIIQADTTSIERINIPVVVAYTANTSANLPSLGTASANGNLAPISTAAGASATAAIPRFVDTAANRTALTINSCRTNILFPFVSNIAGFDTGLAISNTSKDPFGTSIQTGACTVNFYGTIGNSKVCLSFPSPSIAGGEHFVWTLSSGGAVQATAGFQGYVIAQCAFQYGHGFAFISDLGAQRLAMGYLALVMDDHVGTRTGSRSETLGH